MTKNYYAVTAKFGHVGQAKYIIRTVPVIAENGKKAAEITRWMSRVKHHDKNAILNVIEITKEQYQILEEQNTEDPYFNCKNIQQQKLQCQDMYKEVYSMMIEDDEADEKRKIDRQMRIIFQQKKSKSRHVECRYLKRNQYRTYAN